MCDVFESVSLIFQLTMKTGLLFITIAATASTALFYYNKKTKYTMQCNATKLKKAVPVDCEKCQKVSIIKILTYYTNNTR